MSGIWPNSFEDKPDKELVATERKKTSFVSILNAPAEPIIGTIFSKYQKKSAQWLIC